MRIIIVRHGETEENKKRILMGHIPGILSTNGIKQAKEIAKVLKNEKIDVIYSSDLDRAVKTTEEIAKYHNVPVFHSKDLREQNYGIFQGKPIDQLIEANNKSKQGTNFKPQGGESLEEVKSRLKLFINKVYQENKGNTILISAHAGIAWCIYSIYSGIPLEEVMKMQPKNTGILIIDAEESKGTIIEDSMC